MSLFTPKSASQERAEAIDNGRYHGSDARRESGHTWQDSAEATLRAIARQRQETIDRMTIERIALETAHAVEIAQLERQLAKAKRLLSKARKAREKASSNVTPMKRRAAI